MNDKLTIYLNLGPFLGTVAFSHEEIEKILNKYGFGEIERKTFKEENYVFFENWFCFSYKENKKYTVSEALKNIFKNKILNMFLSEEEDV